MAQLERLRERHHGILTTKDSTYQSFKLRFAEECRKAGLDYPNYLAPRTASRILAEEVAADRALSSILAP